MERTKTRPTDTTSMPLTRTPAHPPTHQPPASERATKLLPNRERHNAGAYAYAPARTSAHAFSGSNHAAKSRSKFRLSPLNIPGSKSKPA